MTSSSQSRLSQGFSLNGISAIIHCFGMNSGSNEETHRAVCELLIAVIVLGSFIPIWRIAKIGTPIALSQPYMREKNAEELKQHRKMIEMEYARYAFACSGIILSLFLFRIAIHASSSFSRERERHTLDSLLTCPVMPVDLLAAKWSGTMLSIRAAWLWPLAVWLIGTTLGSVPPLAFASLFVSWLIYAGSIACLGNWYSMICSSSTEPSFTRWGQWLFFSRDRSPCRCSSRVGRIHLEPLQ